jgi:hypothetical protein
VASINWTSVTDYYGGLSTGVPPNVQTDALAYANRVVNVARMGGEDHQRTKLARVHLAAHWGLTWQKQNDSTVSAEDVVEETIGASSITLTYAQRSLVPDNIEELTETTAGRAYLSLVNRSACRVGFVPGC